MQLVPQSQQHPGSTAACWELGPEWEKEGPSRPGKWWRRWEGGGRGRGKEREEEAW